MDPFAELKAIQREGWKHYAALQVHTTRTAAHLVRVAGVAKGQRVLDVACGTGSVAITARLGGAQVQGIDLTPELLERARQNCHIAGVDDILWHEGDVETLPFASESFDVVLSQFGHIFAPRAEVAIREMLRVLRPGGTIAFSTWPPEAGVGRLFKVIGKHLPPPPGTSSPLEWGNAATIEQRLGSAVTDLYFEHGILEHVALSLPHARLELEGALGPVIALVQKYRDDAERLAAIRREIDKVQAPYYRENILRLEYLVTRAQKQ
jgi:ubiquinone/menaquinone biosynthesis C-methylase UbiE